MKAKADVPFVPLNIAVLTVSDTRTLETDTSGQVFVDRLAAAGHNLAARVLLKMTSTKFARKSPTGSPTMLFRLY